MRSALVGVSSQCEAAGGCPAALHHEAELSARGHLLATARQSQTGQRQTRKGDGAWLRSLVGHDANFVLDGRGVLGGISNANVEALRGEVERRRVVARAMRG